VVALGHLPYNRCSDSCSSLQWPELSSRHLYAGYRSPSKQVSGELVPDQNGGPGLDIDFTILRRLNDGSLVFVSLTHTSQSLTITFHNAHDPSF